MYSTNAFADMCNLFVPKCSLKSHQGNLTTACSNGLNWNTKGHVEHQTCRWPHIICFLRMQELRQNFFLQKFWLPTSSDRMLITVAITSFYIVTLVTRTREIFKQNTHMNIIRKRMAKSNLYKPSLILTLGDIRENSLWQTTHALWSGVAGHIPTWSLFT